jgi:hypothetical protein
MHLQRELSAADIKAFLASVAHGRLAALWTDAGPVNAVAECLQDPRMLSHGERLLLQLVCDLWSGQRTAAVTDLIRVLPDGDLAAVLDLITLARPGLRR